jgi:glycosyltransferase involved in cell wall biosynthesis
MKKNNNMKIGIDIRLIGKQRTGDEVVFFNLVKNLAKLDENNEYVLFADAGQVAISNEITKRLEINAKNNFQIAFLKTSNKFLWNFWTLPNYLRVNPVDVYLTQYITPFLVSKKIKIITIVHDISFNFFGQFIKFKDLFFLKTLIPLSLRRADVVVGVSEFTKNEIIKFYNIDPDKVDFVHNAIGDEFFENKIEKEEIEKVAEKYGLPEKFILYMGTLQPRKNIGQLIAAFARITERLPETKLVLCGSRSGHNFDKEIDRAIAVNALDGKVIFAGFVDEKDKAAVFAAANVFVFPSLYEGFGIPVLEAMSQSVPVLASDIPSLKEVAQDGAEYFNINNLDDFAEKLYNISINNDVRSGLIQVGHQRISFFSWEKSAKKFLAIFEKLRHN